MFFNIRTGVSTLELHKHTCNIKFRSLYLHTIVAKQPLSFKYLNIVCVL